LPGEEGEPVWIGLPARGNHGLDNHFGGLLAERAHLQHGQDRKRQFVLGEEIDHLGLYAPRIACPRYEGSELDNRFAVCVADQIVEALADLRCQAAGLEQRREMKIERTGIRLEGHRRLRRQRLDLRLRLLIPVLLTAKDGVQGRGREKGDKRQSKRDHRARGAVHNI